MCETARLCEEWLCPIYSGTTRFINEYNKSNRPTIICRTSRLEVHYRTADKDRYQAFCLRKCLLHLDLGGQNMVWPVYAGANVMTFHGLHAYNCTACMVNK